MSDLEQRFYEDRALRNAARRNLLSDIEHVRENLSGQGIVDRVLGRVGDGAVDVLELAKQQAEDKRGVLAALIGAILVWLAREPIFEFLGLGEAEQNKGQIETGDPSPEDHQETSGDDNDD